MKKYILILSVLLCNVMALAQSEEDAVKKVVTSAYVEGIHNNGSIDEIRKGFHPTFNMLRLMENDVKPLPIEEWITSIEKRRKETKPEDKPVRTDAKFVSVDVTGNAATVKLELSKGGKKIFTDYIVLYKFNEGWKIVSKTFYRHP